MQNGIDMKIKQKYIKTKKSHRSGIIGFTPSAITALL